LHFKNIYWASFEAMSRKGLNAMPALLKFLVPLAIFFSAGHLNAFTSSASHLNAFTSLSWVAGNQVPVNHLTQLHQPMSNAMNEQTK
jgi:hypothetical protein